MWARLVDVARTEAPEQQGLPPELVVIGDVVDDSNVTRSIYYCLDCKRWSGEVVPLFRWVPGAEPVCAYPDIRRLPHYQRLLTKRWLRERRDK